MFIAVCWELSCVIFVVCSIIFLPEMERIICTVINRGMKIVRKYKMINLVRKFNLDKKKIFILSALLSLLSMTALKTVVKPKSPVRHSRRQAINHFTFIALSIVADLKAFIKACLEVIERRKTHPLSPHVLKLHSIVWIHKSPVCWW